MLECKAHDMPITEPPRRSSLKLPAFTLISGIGWWLDFLIFNYLVALGYTYAGSNLISAAAAVTFVLITARRWVFRNHAEKLNVVVLKYVLWNVFAVTGASFLIQLIASGLEMIDIAAVVSIVVWDPLTAHQEIAVVANVSKLLVTPITMYANFVMAGYIIERRISIY